MNFYNSAMRSSRIIAFSLRPQPWWSLGLKIDRKSQSAGLPPTTKVKTRTLGVGLKPPSGTRISVQPAGRPRVQPRLSRSVVWHTGQGFSVRFQPGLTQSSFWHTTPKVMICWGIDYKKNWLRTCRLRSTLTDLYFLFLKRFENGK